jgi:hypothetical protein
MLSRRKVAVYSISLYEMTVLIEALTVDNIVMGDI